MARKNINNDPNPKRSKSQKARILERLQAGDVLTPMSAILGKMGTKLATRVSELILKDGHTEIQKEMVWVKDSDGNPCHVMSYRITEPKLDMAV